MALNKIVATELFTAWLSGQRWFSGKNVQKENITVRSLDLIDIPNHPMDCERLKLAIVQLSYGSNEKTFLAPIQLQLRNHEITGFLDATSDPIISDWILKLVLSCGTERTEAGRFVGHSVLQTTQAAPVSKVRSTAPLGVNASNTSILINTQDGNDTQTEYVIKLFRTYHVGLAPEVEIGLHLAHCGWSGSPPLIGWLEYIPAGTEQGGVVATVHDAITNTTDAWKYSINSLAEDIHARNTLHDLATRIGVLTAMMHKVLATTKHSTEFSPVVPSPGETLSVAHAMTTHALAVRDLLSTADVPKTLHTRLKSVLARWQSVQNALQIVADFPHSAAFIRVHGDYHLGQLLIDPERGTLHVIDFEGEPQRTLAERRCRTSIFKDLAGMGRSFDYLCHRTENRKLKVKGNDLTQAFLASYKDRIAGESFYPDTQEEADTLFNAYMLDKAIYELAYEAQHRPEWLETPLSALESFLQQGAAAIVQPASSSWRASH